MTTVPHILVTGCSSGIGRATALRLAAAGHHVFAGVRKPADGDALQQAARRMPGEITPLRLDVTSPTQIAVAVPAVTGHVGAAGLAGLVNRGHRQGPGGAAAQVRYLTGKNSRRMALIAAILPVPAQDALRRRLTRQQAPGSRVRHTAPPSLAGRPAASG